jgi:hypothetical protein
MKIKVGSLFFNRESINSGWELKTEFEEFGSPLLGNQY